MEECKRLLIDEYNAVSKVMLSPDTRPERRETLNHYLNGIVFAIQIVTKQLTASK